MEGSKILEQVNRLPTSDIEGSWVGKLSPEVGKLGHEVYRNVIKLLEQDTTSHLSVNRL